MLKQLSLLTLASASLALGKRPITDVSALIKHTGESVGKEVDYNGSKLANQAMSRRSSERLIQNAVTQYVTGEKSDTAVLYLTDVFGIQLNENRL